MRYKILIASMLYSFPVLAADISRESGSDGIDLISVSGTFTEGDDATFRRLAAASERAVVVLNSGGGSLHVGLETGELFAFGDSPLPSHLTRYARQPAR
ncbi:hypothetical protein [Rhizobium leguminosarum]|uniref:hypothetical protein n=1 Tax=Rhizobium leguminosarum TaxID=384 RepID=UPI001FDFA8A0|nr:hypothetical protein [Rhizobium leguminosarum]